MGWEDQERGDDGRWVVGTTNTATLPSRNAPDSPRELTSEHKRAIMAFTADDQTTKRIRKTDETGQGPSGSKQIVRDLSQAIAWHGSDVGTVYRGLGGLTKKQADAILKSKVLGLKALSSTSTRPEVAVGYARGAVGAPKGRDHGIILEIRGAHGLPIADHSVHPGEHEVLLSKQGRYAVREVNRTEHENVRHVVLEAYR